MELSEEALAGLFEFMAPLLDERQRRLLAGAMSNALGRGGQAAVVRASKMSSRTVFDGAKQAREGAGPSDRVRAEGGGRPRLTELDPSVVDDLERLVDPDSRGDPTSPLRWTLKSTRQLADALVAMGHRISSWSVGQLLHRAGYSLQGTAKTVEGAQHPDRDGQFRYINALAGIVLGEGGPVISVDTKKKELVVGTKANRGKEWQPTGEPERVEVHDFPNPDVPKAVPYGVYDLGANEGWVEVGSDHDTASFAVNAIRRWWQTMGSARYPQATKLMVTADAGGSNSYRNRLWKLELAALAAETGLEITVCHYPPGTSKWNKVEHRLFSFITINWRGRPLTSYRTIVELAAATTTKTGLRVQAEWDQGTYPKGTKVTKQQVDQLPLERHDWHGEWNYTLRPGATGPSRTTRK